MKIRGGPVDATLSNACLDNKKNGIRDLSILQKPIQTSITGFKEVVKAYKDGTEEVKSFILKSLSVRLIFLHFSVLRFNCCWPTSVI